MIIISIKYAHRHQRESIKSSSGDGSDFESNTYVVFCELSIVETQRFFFITRLLFILFQLARMPTSFDVNEGGEITTVRRTPSLIKIELILKNESFVNSDREGYEQQLTEVGIECFTLTFSSSSDLFKIAFPIDCLTNRLPITETRSFSCSSELEPR